MREIVKIRVVAGSLVVSLPQSVLEPVGLKEGDRVILEAAPPRRLIITKEGKTLTSTQHLEMEIDLLEKQMTAMESDLRYKHYQYEHNMPCDQGMSDSSVAGLILEGLVRDRDRLDVEIAEKRIQLYELQAGEHAEDGKSSTDQNGKAVAQELLNVKAPIKPEPRAKKGWYHWVDEDGRHLILAFANHKGACSVRRYNPNDGTALRRRPNRRGDYQESFTEYLSGATPLHLSKPVRLEDCEKQLPKWLLGELQSQISLPS